ncbi:MAG: [FeFe] hydrogenase H-cluster radical SAM maturase HydE [Prolixibacteraceae bacterium]
MKTMADILRRQDFSAEDLVFMLNASGNDRQLLFQAAAARKVEVVGPKVYFRGLIEFSNICAKDCLYCGIRRSNEAVVRYIMPDAEILHACRFAWENRFGSVVLQSGELSSPTFTRRVESLLKSIKKMSDGQLGITLSCGEQKRSTYKRWFEAGAHRYLLRIESSDPELYTAIHPKDGIHDFERRLECLYLLRQCGYQVGTGVMIGLPFQTPEHLANDLLFMKQLDVDMVGMGPYIEHEDTPLARHCYRLPPKSERFEQTLKMIAALRLLMPDINIASATSLQAIDPMGREKALKTGANIIMPNLTPVKYRRNYQLYDGKPCLDEDAELCSSCLTARAGMADAEPGFNEWGDSRHFTRRKQMMPDQPPMDIP